MKVEVLDNIPLKLDSPTIKMRLRFFAQGAKPGFDKVISELMETVVSIAKPKAVYRISSVSSKSRNSLEIDGVKFTNYLLRVNLDKVQKVFPYVVTCGTELGTLQIPATDVVKDYCLSVMKDMVLNSAASYLQDYIARRFGFDYLWSLSPGELHAWPRTSQKPLFAILGNVDELIGVKLQKNNTLIPACSRSGIVYYSETEFEGCQVCPQDPCMGRRAPYSADLAEKYPWRGEKALRQWSNPFLR